MRQIRYPHVYDICIILCARVFTHTLLRRPIVTSVSVGRRWVGDGFGGKRDLGGRRVVGGNAEEATKRRRRKLNCRSSTKGLSGRGIGRCCRNAYERLAVLLPRYCSERDYIFGFWDVSYNTVQLYKAKYDRSLLLFIILRVRDMCACVRSAIDDFKITAQIRIPISIYP